MNLYSLHLSRLLPVLVLVACRGEEVVLSDGIPFDISFESSIARVADSGHVVVNFVEGDSRFPDRATHTCENWWQELGSADSPPDRQLSMVFDAATLASGTYPLTDTSRTNPEAVVISLLGEGSCPPICDWDPCKYCSRGPLVWASDHGYVHVNVLPRTIELTIDAYGDSDNPTHYVDRLVAERCF